MFVYVKGETVFSGVYVCETHHTGRQRGQIQQLLVLLEGEKLQGQDQDKPAVRKPQSIYKPTSLHTFTPTFKNTTKERGTRGNIVSTQLVHGDKFRGRPTLKKKKGDSSTDLFIGAKGKMPTEAF